MPKPRFLELDRPEPIRKTETFTDLAFPNDPITLTIVTRHEAVETSDMAIKTQQLWNQYGPKDQYGNLNIELFWGGEKLRITWQLCQQIATIMTLDDTPQPDRMDFHEWAIASAGMKDAFNGAYLWVVDVAAVNGKVRHDEEDSEAPNDSAASSEPTSEPPQSTTQQVTLP